MTSGTVIGIDWQRFRGEKSRILATLREIANRLEYLERKHYARQTDYLKKHPGAASTLPLRTENQIAQENLLRKKFHSQSIELVKIHRAIYRAAEQHDLSPLSAVMSISDCVDEIVTEAIRCGIPPVCTLITKRCRRSQEKGLRTIARRFLEYGDAQKLEGADR